MTRWSAVVAALGAVASTVVWAQPASAAACSGTGGVTVVVDFKSLGGGARIGCAPGDPASGLATLDGAGFGYTFAGSQPGLVCRISGKPTQDQDRCARPSPTTAYWSYWHATRGGSWVYSTAGAGTRDPAPGTVEGWSFGAGSPPGPPPPAPPAAPKPPAPEPPAEPPAQPPAQPPVQPGKTTEPGSAGRPRAGTTSAPAANAPSSTAAPSPSVVASSSAAAAGVPSTGAVSAEVEPRAEESVADEQGGGGAVSFLVGAGVVVVLGGLAVAAARRRAKADP